MGYATDTRKCGMGADKKITVELCMGSSCFARGNSSALSELESYLEENELDSSVELEGHLCLGKCNSGPHIKIDGVEYSAISPDCVIDLVKEALDKNA